MYRLPPRPSPSARRKAPTWNLRFPSSTKVPCHTRLISSCLPTSSPGRSTRAGNISSARLPTRTGLSSSSRSRCVGTRRKGPNEIARSFETAARSTTPTSLEDVRTGQFVKQQPRRLQIGGPEPFGKAAMDRRQKIECLPPAPLVAPLSGEAHRHPHFPPHPPF